MRYLWLPALLALLACGESVAPPTDGVYELRVTSRIRSCTVRAWLTPSDPTLPELRDSLTIAPDAEDVIRFAGPVGTYALEVRINQSDLPEIQDAWAATIPGGQRILCS